MRLSLRFKITCILSLSVFLAVFLCWFANETLLNSFYQREKVESLCRAYDEVNQIANRVDSMSERDYIHSIDMTETGYSVNVYIVSSQTLRYIYPIELDLSKNQLSVSNRYERITYALREYIFGSLMEDSLNQIETLNSNEHYDVYKFYDNEVDASFIDLVGVLDCDDLIFVRTGCENIEESTLISSRFMAYIGIFVILAGSIFMYFFAGRLVRPINELSVISDKMSALDFEAKYSGKRKDEIGKLGESINSLSLKLENTITELKEANIELEKDIADKMAVDEMRKEFLSNVSHELKTPLALIMGYAEGLKDNVNDDEESRNFYCDVIADEASKMNSLVKKLLSLNEIEFGKNKLDVTRFNLTELIKGVAANMSLLKKDTGVKLVVDIAQDYYVWADENLIEEVVTNYLSNAYNHVDEQKIIDISCHMRDDNSVRVSVFNTGRPIPEDELEKIWLKFYKVDKARTREYGGNGIGLSIVKAIMEQHKKECGAVNHTAGVEFWFEIDSKSE